MEVQRESALLLVAPPLPSLLVTLVQQDIRAVSLVNTIYAVAHPPYPPLLASARTSLPSSQPVALADANCAP